jgi:hypothetical protein
MATYKYQQFIQQVSDSVFDTVHPAASRAPRSGIYRCEGCGHEVVSTAGNHLPPQNHHQHNYSQGSIRWRLIVTHR